MIPFSLDDISSKKLNVSGQRRQFYLNRFKYQKWLEETFVRPEDRDVMMYKALMEPTLPLMLIKQNECANWEKVLSITSKIRERRGGIYLITGNRGTGKTCLAYFLCEELAKKGEKVWWYGPPVKLPSFIAGSTMDFDRIPENTTTIIDEASVQFYSRSHDHNIDVIQKLPVIRHSGRNFLFISQATSLTDINILRQADGVFFKGYPAFGFEGSERDAITIHKDLYHLMPTQKSEVLFLDNEGLMLLETPVPKWWDNGYSTPYSPFRDKAELYRFMLQLLPECNDRQIAFQASLKGTTVDIMEIMNLRMMCMTLPIEFYLGLDDMELVEAMKLGWDETPVNRLVEGKPQGKKYSFELFPIQEETLAKRKAQDALFELYSRRCVNQILLNDLLKRVKKEGHVLIMVIGETGTGKSYACLSLAEILSFLLKRKFIAKNIAFSPESAYNRVGEIANKVVIICEEVGVKRHGSGSGRASDEMSNLVQTLRQRQISFVYNAPEPGNLLTNYVLETNGIDYRGRVARLLLYSKSTDRTPLGFITLEAPSEGIVKEYEKRKGGFLDKVQSRKVSEKGHDKLVEELLADSVYTGLKTLGLKLTYVKKKYPYLGTEEAKDVRNEAEIANVAVSKG